jgi:ribosomal protein S18 acetylase RimI-like enzyme
MTSIEVRLYEPADHDSVVDLWKLCFPKDPPWNEPVEMIRRKTAQNDNLFWVAAVDDRVVGTILAGYDGVRGWIYHLATHPNFRRLGLATSLMTQAEERLRELGCPKINLQVRKSNMDVVSFYTAYGFKEDQTLIFGLRLENSD